MKNLLLFLDADTQPSAFDQVVAYDAGVDAVLAYGGITPDNCFALVEGAIYTRAPKDKRHTAILVGGSNLHQAQAVADAVQTQFFSNFRVSVALDANGCNTTGSSGRRYLGGRAPFGEYHRDRTGGHRPGRAAGRRDARPVRRRSTPDLPQNRALPNKRAPILLNVSALRSSLSLPQRPIRPLPQLTEPPWC